MSKTISRFGCGAVLGIALALPAGTFLGSRQTEPSQHEQRAAMSSGLPRTPNLYSPKVLSDPYVMDQHRRIAEALERSCAEQELYCEEAKLARRKIAQTQAR